MALFSKSSASEDSNFQKNFQQLLLMLLVFCVCQYSWNQLHRKNEQCTKSFWCLLAWPTRCRFNQPRTCTPQASTTVFEILLQRKSLQKLGSLKVLLFDQIIDMHSCLHHFMPLHFLTLQLLIAFQVRMGCFFVLFSVCLASLPVLGRQLILKTETMSD